MDCLRAQQLVSDALDGLPVDDAELREAKRHCGTCPECAAFVRGLLAFKSSPPPAPPAELPDIIMARVREEARTAALNRTRTIAAPGRAGLPQEDSPISPATGPSFSEAWRRALEPRRRARTIAWVGSAAVVFILAGWGAVIGARSILAPPPIEYEFVGATVDGAAPLTSSPSSSQPEEGLGVAPPASSSRSAAAPRLVTIDGVVYQHTGVAPPDSVIGDPITRTSAALEADARPKTRDVFAGSGSGTVYVEGDDDDFLIFERMTTTFEGALYVLKSDPLTEFGAWPSLPSPMEQPTGSDGSPTFEAEESDSGATVYRLDSWSSKGFALPPNPTVVPQLSQCPNWTWWEPAID